MNLLSIKLKTLVLFIAAIFFVAASSLCVTIYKAHTLATSQIESEKQLILDTNKNELKAYTMMAERAIHTFYEASSSKEQIAEQVKKDALTFK